MNKKLIILCVIIAGAILYWAYRQDTLGTVLPYFIIALCPLMHLFMMKGMHQSNNKESSKKNDEKNQSCH